MRRPSKKKLLQVIRQSSGIIYPIAQAYDVTRQTVYNWINSDEDLKKALQDSRDNVIDVVESKYFKNAMEGSERAQEFLLKTLGKDRGYVEKKEIDANVETDFTLPKITNEELEYLMKLNASKKQN